MVPSLYGEPAGVILVSTPPERASDVIRTAEAHGVMAVEMGGVGGPDIIVRGEGAELLRVAVAQASEAWESAIPAAMDTM